MTLENLNSQATKTNFFTAGSEMAKDISLGELHDRIIHTIKFRRTLHFWKCKGQDHGLGPDHVGARNLLPKAALLPWFLLFALAGLGGRHEPAGLIGDDPDDSPIGAAAASSVQLAASRKGFRVSSKDAMLLSSVVGGDMPSGAEKAGLGLGFPTAFGVLS